MKLKNIIFVVVFIIVAAFAIIFFGKNETINENIDGIKKLLQEQKIEEVISKMEENIGNKKFIKDVTPILKDSADKLLNLVKENKFNEETLKNFITTAYRLTSDSDFLDKKLQLENYIKEKTASKGEEADDHYSLGIKLISMDQLYEGILHLKQVVESDPHYKEATNVIKEKSALLKDKLVDSIKKLTESQEFEKAKEELKRYKDIFMEDLQSKILDKLIKN